MVNSIALIASEMLPLPLELKNLAAMMLVVQLTPTTPMLLLPSAPIVPDTCVPWLLSSIGSQVLEMALNPCVPAPHVIVVPPIVTVKLDGADQTLAARS
jgi:hypothetical protein